MEFEWDAGKAASNLSKHGISFAEAMTVLNDTLEVMIPDPAQRLLRCRRPFGCLPANLAPWRETLFLRLTASPGSSSSACRTSFAEAMTVLNDTLEVMIPDPAQRLLRVGNHHFER